VDLKVHLVGYIAASFTTFSLLPQIIRIRRLKEAKDVSLVMPLMVAAGSLLWTVYGFLISSPPVIVANAIALIISIVTVVFAIKYR
jgi:MtN3 and saliva related transmembrane protein